MSETSQRAKTDTEAVHYAALKGWIDFSPKRDPHSVTLTDAGRDLPK